MDNGIERVLITAEEIEEKVAELGKKSPLTAAPLPPAP